MGKGEGLRCPGREQGATRLRRRKTPETELSRHQGTTVRSGVRRVEEDDRWQRPDVEAFLRLRRANKPEAERFPQSAWQSRSRSQPRCAPRRYTGTVLFRGRERTPTFPRRNASRTLRPPTRPRDPPRKEASRKRRVFSAGGCGEAGTSGRTDKQTCTRSQPFTRRRVRARCAYFRLGIGRSIETSRRYSSYASP
jgi:hypothetical protein